MTLERGPADSRDPVSPASSRAAGQQGPDDRTLVARVAAGDGGALEALYERYGRACYSLARGSWSTSSSHRTPCRRCS
jgi:hypothetical protein